VIGSSNWSDAGGPVAGYVARVMAGTSWAARQRRGRRAVAKLVTLTRMGAGLAVLTIIVLSTVPGKMRPHILGNDYFEHFTAYFITGSLWAIGCLRPMRLLSSGVLLATCAGTLEFVQLWIPGRNASAGDFAASAIGAWVGLLIIVAVRQAHERKFIVSYK
jgi:VanZ family protein